MPNVDREAGSVKTVVVGPAAVGSVEVCWPAELATSDSMAETPADEAGVSSISHVVSQRVAATAASVQCWRHVLSSIL